MLKKNRILYFILPLILMLSACSSLKLPGTSSNASTPSQQAQNRNGQGQMFNLANQPVEQKLALGTLKLEGTDKAVTAEEAKTLLPLWKAMKTLSASSNTSAEEVNALYKQIEEAMTPDQVQAIKDISLNQTDLQALMKQYGIQAPQMAFRNQNGTPVARPQGNGNGGSGAQAGAGGQGFGGRGAGGGFQGGGNMGGGGGNFAGGGQANPQRTPRARGTPGAWQGNRGFRGGMNTMFVDPLIKLLQGRAGVQPTPTVQ